ncbi:hypothetical protein ACFL6M_04840 [Candidatus Eisenbacteria bacterium]|uniref:Uncharacterized protein n=1 Tax=Eiseniibacteriota bacterium TaxID=2212470 RepID=A0ABV6YKS2_UNCEI
MVHRNLQRLQRQRGGRVFVRAALVAVLLIVVPILAGSAQGQTGQAAEQVWREILKTDQVIEKAREFSGQVAVAASHRHLKTAVDIQRAARDEFKRKRYRQAADMTLKARREALKALDAARVERKTQESVRHALELAEEQLENTTGWVHDSGDSQARRVLDQGVEHLRRARRANRERQYAQAMRLATLASNLFDRAARIARGEITAGAAAEVSIERTRGLLTQVESTLIESGRAPNTVPGLIEAQKLLRHALESLREGRTRRALRFSLAARKEALHLLSELSQEPGESDLLETIEELQALYAEMGPEIEAAGDRQEGRMLAEGRKLLRRARQLLGGGKRREALQHMLAAERLLKEAARSAGI